MPSPPPPCHPLLAAAEAGAPEAEGRAGRLALATGAGAARLRAWPGAAAARLATLRRHRPGPAVAAAEPAPPEGRLEAPALLAQPGRPLVVAVGGSRGGSGRSTVAHGLAATLAERPGAGPVILVDGDLGAPDQDLRVGGDGHPTLADLLDDLPLLAAGEGAAGSYLPRDPVTGMHVLLAPPSAGYRAGIGPEHLDYVLTYVLAPAFTAIVVDLDRGMPGGASGEPAVGCGFWLSRTDVVLVPFRGDPCGVRAARAYRDACVRWGVPEPAVWPLLNGDRPGPQRAAGLEPGITELARLRLPWLPDPALRALVARRPLPHVDAGARAAYLGLAESLARWGALRADEAG